MGFKSRFHTFEQKGIHIVFESGDTVRDELLLGGFHYDLLYLLYSDKRNITDIILRTAVYAFKDKNFEKKVAFLDRKNSIQSL